MEKSASTDMDNSVFASNEKIKKHNPQEFSQTDIKATGSENYTMQQKKAAQQSPFSKPAPAQLMRDPEEENEETTQKKAGNVSQSHGTSSATTALPSSFINRSKEVLGEDMSSVKVHPESKEAPQMGALAFARGNDIHFAPGKYAPETNEGQQLIGHELTHVAQQKKGQVSPTTQMKGQAVNDDSSLEKEADQKGAEIANGQTSNTPGVSAAASGVPQKKEDEVDQTSLTAEQSQKVKQKAESAADGAANPIQALLSTMLNMMSTYLGSSKGSKLTGNLGIEVPISVGRLKFGFEVEQERKDDKTQIANQLKGMAGIAVKIPHLGEGSAEFAMFLGAESSDFQTSAQLLSYGFYKSGRVAADLLNNWKAAAQGGLPSSLAIYYGLNYIYADNNESILAQAKDDVGAEDNVAEMERELFGINTDGTYEDGNNNEASYGAAAKLGINVADDTFTGELEGSLATKLTQQSLRDSGIMGAQRNPGFFEDYEVGGQREFALKLASAFNVGSFSGSKEMIATFDKTKKRSSWRSDENSGWKFQKLEFSIAYALENITSLDFTEREILQQLIQAGVSAYNAHRALTRKKDPDARPLSLNSHEATDSICKQAKSALTQTTGAMLLDGLEATGNMGGMLETTDKIQGKLKITAEGDKKPELLFQIGRATEIAVDAELFKGQIVDFTPLVNFTFNQ